MSLMLPYAKLPTRSGEEPIFDPDALTELFRPKGLGWKARAHAELALMEDLIPLLRKKAEGREISGVEVYEDV